MTTRSLARSKPALGRVVLALWVGLALALSACDARNDTSGDSASNNPVDSGGDPCLASLSDFTDVSGFCAADADAAGGDVLCYTVHGIADIDPATVTTKIDPPSDLYGYFHTYDGGGTATEVGLTMGTSSGGDDGISMLIGAGQTATGVFPLGRFSSWSGPNQANYRAIGQAAGCGHTKITQYGPQGGGRIAGHFDAKMCAYNDAVHEVQCTLGQIRFQGSFDITRGDNITGGSGAPF